MYLSIYSKFEKFYSIETLNCVAQKEPRLQNFEKPFDNNFFSKYLPTVKCCSQNSTSVDTLVQNYHPVHLLPKLGNFSNLEKFLIVDIFQEFSLSHLKSPKSFSVVSLGF